MLDGVIALIGLFLCGISFFFFSLPCLKTEAAVKISHVPYFDILLFLKLMFALSVLVIRAKDVGGISILWIMTPFEIALFEEVNFTLARQNRCLSLKIISREKIFQPFKVQCA